MMEACANAGTNVYVPCGCILDTSIQLGNCIPPPEIDCSNCCSMLNFLIVGDHVLASTPDLQSCYGNPAVYTSFIFNGKTFYVSYNSSQNCDSIGLNCCPLFDVTRIA